MKKHLAPADHDTLQESFVKFAQDVLALAEQWPEAKNVPMVTERHLIFEKHSWRKEYISKPDYWRIFHRHFESEILPLASAETCAMKHIEAGIIREPIMSDSAGNPIECPTFDQMRWFLVQQILSAVICVVSQHRSFNPASDQIREGYIRFRELWERKTITHILIAPLVNFDSTVGSMHISSECAVVPFLDDTKSALWSLSFHEDPWVSFIGFAQFVNSLFCVKSARTFLVDEARNYSAFSKQVYRIVSALRLVKAGDVGSPCFYGTPEDIASSREIGDPVGIEASTLSASTVRESWVEPYELLETDIKAFLGIYEAIGACENEGTLDAFSTALSRFNMAYQRDELSDRIMDACIALESSLLFGIDQELRYRLALRGAALLADVKAPSETAAILESMYDIRSRIVHGGMRFEEACSKVKVPAYQDPFTFAKECIEVTRMVLRAYLVRLASGTPLAQMNEHLDAHIIAGVKKT